MAGKLIRLFLADGDAEGIRTIEISNMTIFGTIFSRPMFDEFKKRQEAKKPGVYLLYGEDYETNDAKLYIGEGDPIINRIDAHNRNGTGKDFWSKAIVFTSKDDYITKTQIQYLESKLIGLAKKADRVKLDNSNLPTKPNISEVDCAEVETFLDNILLLMKALEYDFFTPMTPIKPVIVGLKETYIMNYSNAIAKMAIVGGKYILLKDSTLKRKDAPASKQPLRELRKKLLNNNNISVLDDNLYTVNEDLEFNSASAAASVVAGLGVNGLIWWKCDGKTIKELESQQAIEE